MSTSSGKGKQPKEWAEPFQNLTIGSGVDPQSPPAITPGLISRAVSDRLLSEMALGYAYDWLQIDMHQYADITVVTSENKSSLLLDLSVALTIQSYELACNEFDEPQLAIYALLVLGLICEKFPERIPDLMGLAAIDEQAQARVFRQCIFSGIPMRGDPEYLLRHLIIDMRTAMKRQHHQIMPLLDACFECATPIIERLELATSGDILEVLYLVSEFHNAKGDFWRVQGLFEARRAFLSECEQSESLNLPLRRVKRSLARAECALGEWASAKRHYLESGATATAEIDACIAKNQVHVSATPNVNVQFMDATAMPNGDLAIFFRSNVEAKLGVVFKVFDTQSNSFKEDIPLPGNGIGWRAVKVLPGILTESLCLLVAPRSEGVSETMTDDIMERINSMFPGASGRQSAIRNVQLFEYQYDDAVWKEITTWGSIPDSYALLRLGSHCSVVNGNLILLGGSQMGNMGLSSTDPTSSAGAFFLNFPTREWLRIPHPYQQSMFVDKTTGKPVWDRHCINISLPPFCTVFNVKLHGREMLAMTRSATDPNPNRNNELTPKYSLDLLDISEDHGLVQFDWSRRIEVADPCGHIVSHMKPSSIRIGSTALIIGTRYGSMVQHLMPDGTTKTDDMTCAPSYSPASITALDLMKMEWRGLDIVNSELLRDMGLYSQLIKSKDENVCYGVFLNKDKLGILKIGNLSSIEKCYTEPLSDRKRLSKKNMLSYMLAKAEKKRTQALRECASCSVFERSGEKFSICARCKSIRYCSRNCQKEHWKTHKHECLKAVD